MNTEQHAEQIAASVDSSKVGFDPVTIITILTTVLPLITSCFKRNDQSDPEQVSAAVRAAHERNPDALRRRTARRIRGDADHSMSKEASFELARATIAHAMQQSASAVAAYCRSVE
jgi:hypothetical protein